MSNMHQQMGGLCFTFHIMLLSEKISRQLKRGLHFYASARGLNVSLNSCLEVGPPLHPDLVAILLCFRKNQLRVMGDIEKMLL